MTYVIIFRAGDRLDFIREAREEVLSQFPDDDPPAAEFETHEDAEALASDHIIARLGYQIVEVEV